jgi:uncharacterized membrane protein YgaE (UPF0421/DUF939 family)
MLDEVCAKCIVKSKAQIKNMMDKVKRKLKKLKEEICSDDQAYLLARQKEYEKEMMKEVRQNNLIMFTQAKQA